MDPRDGSDRTVTSATDGSSDGPTDPRRQPARTQPSATQSFYGRWARPYDLIATWTPGIRAVRRSVAAAALLESGDTVVEFGCGTGANLTHLRDRVGPEGTVVGVDLTRGVLRTARRKTAEFDNVHLIHGDAMRPPFDPAPIEVDAVVATFLVGMLPDAASAVSTWCDLVGPGGRVVLANATPTDHWSGRLLNHAFRLFVVASTPPPTKVRYETDLTARLEDSVAAAHGRLHDRSRAVIDSRQALGFVRLTGGIVGDDGRRPRPTGRDAIDGDERHAAERTGRPGSNKGV
ncbi:class I SAM-dependent methyltransferase [Halovivax cerinus]|uniref:Class I SAM-dependent methyltransferase n=1 Tax=Halovivax cerinus TaxID=1487865 RepID=A0ABD5NJX2_9EURY|nr:class I SAM-dependent methyltransferase [Halovivax cerinus]